MKKIFYIRKNIRFISYILFIYFFFDNSKDPNLIFALSVMKLLLYSAGFVLFLEFIS